MEVALKKMRKDDQMDLEDKIEYEFRCFYLDQMRTSRENIFAHSAEIELKKQLAEALKVFVSAVDGKQKQQLFLQGNLLESAYGYIRDIKNGDYGSDLRCTLKEWLTFLTTDGKALHGAVEA